jgi:serine/threonine-protein kinase
MKTEYRREGSQKMVDRVGQQLGNYQLLRLLGEGGFAEVYLGEHIHLGTEAAIKVLHTQLSNEDVEQFRNEARTIARLKHRHIVRVSDFGVEGKTPFLVMDYASNGTMRQRYPNGKYEEKLLLAEKYGVRTYVLDAASSFTLEHSRRADLVVECSGSAQGLEMALRLVKPRGTLILKSTRSISHAV